MPAFADITINDGQTTPVARLFSTTSRNDGLAVWHFRASGVPAIGWSYITMVQTFPGAAKSGTKSSDDRVVRQKINWVQPKLEALAPAGNGYTPAPTVAYLHRSLAEFVQAERGTVDDRKDQHAFHVNFLNHATIKGMIIDQTSFSG